MTINMATDAENKNVTFGQYLKDIRLQKGISLEDVSNKTRIAKYILFFIERENHDRLPEEVYVKGFLRAYADVVGANGDKAMQLYLSGLHRFQQTVRAEAGLLKSGKKFWIRLLSTLGFLTGIIVLSVFLISVFRSQHQGEARFKHLDDKKYHEPVSKAPGETVVVEKDLEASSPKLSLKITAIKDTWVKVIIDGRELSAYTFNPEDHIELQAYSKYNILIGDACGVRLMINGKPLDVPGKSGQMVNIQIP